MRNSKSISTSEEKVLYQSDTNFDWSLYDTGYEGGTKLSPNKSVKTNGKDIVYSHEPYAQEMYDAYEAWFNGRNAMTAKDNLKGTLYAFNDIKAISDHEVALDTCAGMSTVIDLTKEKKFLNSIGCPDARSFIMNIEASTEYKQSVIQSGIIGKVTETGNISLWDGHLSKVEYEFSQQLKNPDTAEHAYMAKILGINGGGFLADVSGVTCFLPGSLAAAGVLTDFNSMIGKVIPVIVVNYIEKSKCFVVSYKKYLERILPGKIANELEIGQEVYTKVTGASKNGLFCQFKDNEGEWVFSGLVHRSVMSQDFEKRFDMREFRNGDEMKMYIANIIDNEGQTRIVLTDSKMNVSYPKTEEDDD